MGSRSVVRWAALAVVLITGCGAREAAQPVGLDAIADDYVRLVLAVGRHDESYVDAYYGDPAWREQAAAGEPRPIAELTAEARRLLEAVRQQPTSDRRAFLEKQLVAVEGFLRRAAGEPMTLEQEARLLFDVDVRPCPTERIEQARAELDVLLPGGGTLAERMRAFQSGFEVPSDRLPAVVDAALAEARRRTAALVALPEGERFEVELVTDKPWGAYNWYKGDLKSLIEVNTDLPKSLDAVLGTMAHEGYPGHHLYNALLEQRLVRGKGWREYTVYPLYSPQSLIAEGTAEVGVGVIFDEPARLAFVRDVLAPLAGVEGADFERSERVRAAQKALDCVGGEAARMLLDDGRPDEEVMAFLVRYGSTPERARQNLAFFRAYRSYVFTYSVGEELVAAHVGDGPDRVERFFALLDRPVVPSALGARPSPSSAQGS